MALEFIVELEAGNPRQPFDFFLADFLARIVREEMANLEHIRLDLPAQEDGQIFRIIMRLGEEQASDERRFDVLLLNDKINAVLDFYHV